MATVTVTPRQTAERMEAPSASPAGSEEAFVGYGAMALPFRSGHVLALRRFPHSGIGPGYASLWHRTPAGEWAMTCDVPPEQGCPRYFGPVLTATPEAPVELIWLDDWRLRVEAPELSWEMTFSATPATRLLNATGSLLGDRLWRSPAVLGAMGRVAGPVLRAGRVRLHGTAPNGQRFKANPFTIWAIAHSRAMVSGEDLGEPGPLAAQDRLGDFFIPQRGIFAVGRTLFDAPESGHGDHRHHERSRCGGRDGDDHPGPVAPPDR